MKNIDLTSETRNMISDVSTTLEELEKIVADHITKEARQEAAWDAAERDFRAECNRRSAERVAQKEAAQAAQRRLARRKEARYVHRIMRDALREAQRHKFMRRNFGSVSAAAVLVFLYAIGGTTDWLTMAGLILAALYFIANIVAYATRNRKNRA